MVKNNQTGYWIVLSLIVLGGLYYLHDYTDLFSAVVFEDFITYDDRVNPPWQYDDNWENNIYEDELWKIEKIEKTYGDDNKEEIIIYEETPMKYRTYSDVMSRYADKVILTPKQIFKGYDIKIVITCESGQYYSNFAEGHMGPTYLYLNDNKIMIFSGSSTEGAMDKDTSLTEIYSSKLNSSIIDIYLDGIFKETLYLNEGDLSVKIESVGPSICTINSFGYKIPFSCVQGPEELLGLETFVGPRSLSIYDTRYGVTKFCVDHPVILTRTTEQGSTTSAEIYQRLARGEVLQIPEGDTWTVFYIFYNDGSLPAVCPLGAFDIERNKCTNLTGIVYFCSQGVFDPAFGACVVTPDIIPVCPYGRYDVAQDKCIYNPPIQAVCELGDYNSVTGLCEYNPDIDYQCEEGNYNPSTGNCEYIPDTEFVCETDYIYNSDNGLCEYRPDDDIICEVGYTYNELTKMCEDYPEAVIVCPPTFSFNPITSLCEKEVPTDYLCDGDWDPDTFTCTTTVVPNIDYVCPDGTYLHQDSMGRYSCIYEPDFIVECIRGTYDESLDKCVYIPDEEAQCDLGDTYDSVRDICIYEPSSEIFCPQGSWDKEMNACVIQPDMNYLCILGTVAPDNQSCIITPRTRIICPKNTSYDIESEMCLEEGSIGITCPEGSVYSSVQDKCIRTPEEIILCPEGTEYDSEKGKCIATFFGKIDTPIDDLKGFVQFEKTKSLLIGLSIGILIVSGFWFYLKNK